MISICKGGRWREDERRLGDPLGSVTVVSTSFSTNLAPCTTTPWNRKHVGITMRRERRSARGLKYFLIRGIGRSFNLVKSRRRVSSAPPSSTLISCRRSGAFHGRRTWRRNVARGTLADSVASWKKSLDVRERWFGFEPRLVADARNLRTAI